MHFCGNQALAELAQSWLPYDINQLLKVTLRLPYDPMSPLHYLISTPAKTALTGWLGSECHTWSGSSCLWLCNRKTNCHHRQPLTLSASIRFDIDINCDQSIAITVNRIIYSICFNVVHKCKPEEQLCSDLCVWRSARLHLVTAANLNLVVERKRCHSSNSNDYHMILCLILRILCSLVILSLALTSDEKSVCFLISFSWTLNLNQTINIF